MARRMVANLAGFDLDEAKALFVEFRRFFQIVDFEGNMNDPRHRSSSLSAPRLAQPRELIQLDGAPAPNRTDYGFTISPIWTTARRRRRGFRLSCRPQSAPSACPNAYASLGKTDLREYRLRQPPGLAIGQIENHLRRLPARCRSSRS